MKSKLVKQWFKYASTDLKLAKNSLNFSSEFKVLRLLIRSSALKKQLKVICCITKFDFQNRMILVP